MRKSFMSATSMLTVTTGMPRRAVDGSTKLSPVKRAVGGAVLDVDRQHDRRFEHLADRRRQAGAEGDAVVLAVLQALDADLAALGLDAPWARRRRR